VTVLAPTAAAADALSTAFYLLGPAAAAAYVEQHPEIGVLFVAERERGVSTFGVSDHDFVPAAG
jgi:thiamine biosynthesis lipoprotein